MRKKTIILTSFIFLIGIHFFLLGINSIRAAIPYQFNFYDDFDNLSNWTNSTNAPYPLGGRMTINNGYINASSYGSELHDLHGPAVYKNMSMGDFRIEIEPRCQADIFGAGLFSLALYSEKAGLGRILWRFQWGDLWYNDSEVWGGMWLWSQNNDLLWEEGPSANIGSWDDYGDNMTIIHSDSILELYVDRTLKYSNATQNTVTVGSVVIQFCQWKDRPICSDLSLDRIKIAYNNPKKMNSGLNIPTGQIFVSFLILCSTIGTGIIAISIFRKVRIKKALAKYSTLSKSDYNSLIGEIEAEIPDKKTMTPASSQKQNDSHINSIVKEKITHSKDTPSRTDSIVSTNIKTNSTKKFNAITTENLVKRTPFLAILISPLVWIVSQILFPPQLRKLSINEVQENPTRQEIIYILRLREFEHFLALKKELDCGNFHLSWHLQVLEDFDLIRRKKIGNVQVFYLKGSFLDDYKLKLYCSIRNKTSLMVLKCFLEKDSDYWSLNLLSKKIHKSQRVIKYHCKKFLSLGLIERIENNDNQYKIIKVRRQYITWLIERYNLN